MAGIGAMRSAVWLERQLCCTWWPPQLDYATHSSHSGMCTIHDTHSSQSGTCTMCGTHRHLVQYRSKTGSRCHVWYRSHSCWGRSCMQHSPARATTMCSVVAVLHAAPIPATYSAGPALTGAAANHICWGRGRGQTRGSMSLIWLTD